MALTPDRPIAPYAPAANVLTVVRRLHDRAIPVPVTKESLTVLGIPEGNAPRTLQALKLLGIVAEDGQLLEPAEMLRRASQEEYPETLAEIVREAYAPVFKVVDPATDTEVRVSDAFRQYDPATQRGRMVTLFMALCAEARIAQKPQRTGAAQPVRRAQVQERRPTPAKPRIYEAPAGSVPSVGAKFGSDVAGLFGVTEDDMSLLDETQFKAVWDALGTVALAKMKARAEERVKTSRPIDPFLGLFPTKKEGPPDEGH